MARRGEGGKRWLKDFSNYMDGSRDWEKRSWKKGYPLSPPPSTDVLLLSLC
jgi:hypothetical protein